MATPIPLTAGFIVVDTTTAKTFQLPLSTDIVGRSITVKDRTGNAGTNNITIQTQGADTLQGGGTSYKITQPYGSVTLVSRVGQWLVGAGTEQIYASSIYTNFLNVSTLNAIGQISTPNLLTSTVTFVDINNSAKQVLAVSSGVLTLNGQGITGGSGGGGAVTQIIAGTNININPTGGTGAVTINNSINPTGLISTANLSGLVSTANLSGLVSTANLSGLVSTANLSGLVSTANLLNLVSTSFLDKAFVSTVENLAQAGYVSSSQLVSSLSNWALYPAVSSIQLNGFQPIIINTSPIAAAVFQTNTLVIADEFNTPTGLNLGYLTFQTSSSTDAYTFVHDVLVTNTVSSLSLLHPTANETGSLYLSSIYLGNFGGTIYGQLTTDGTASDIYWNGSSLTQGVTTTQLVSTTGGLQTNFIGQQATLSSLYLNLDPFNAPFWDSNVPIVGFDPEPNPLALDVFGSVRILKSLYIGSTTTKIGTGGIQTASLLISSIQALSQVSTANLVASTLKLIDINSLVPQTLAVSSGTLTLNGQGITGGGGGGTGDVTTTQLVSTVTGIQTNLTTRQISTGSVQASTVNLLDTYTSALNYLTVSTGTLLLNGGYITGSGGSAVTQLLAGTNISLTPTGGTGIVTINNTINPTGLVSTANLTNLVSTSFFDTGLVSTVINLGSLGYVSTASLLNLVSTGFFDTRLVSTVINLGTLGYVSTASLTSTVAGLGRNYISTPSLVSTVAGLGQRYISSFSSFSTSIATLFTASNAIFSSMTATNATMCNITVSTITFNTGDGFIDFPDIRALSMSTFIVNACTINAGFLVSTQVLNVSSIIGVSFLTLANVISTTANFVSTASLTSTVAGLGQAGYVSTGGLVSTYSGIIALGLLSTPSLTSTVAGLGQAGYVSTGGLVSTYSGIIALGLLSTPSLTSTVAGLGQAGYVSTASLVSTYSGIVALGLLSTPSLTSTVAGLGQAGYVSTGGLVSTYSGIIALGLLSTPSLTSTVAGLGQAGYVSTGSLVSTYSGIIALGFLSTASLVSTVAGLGQAGYVSTLSNVNNVSANQFVASSFYATLAGPTTLVLYDI